jgi:hypothetical protein
VYRRRRVVVGVLALVVLVAVVIGVAALARAFGGGEGSAAAAPTPTASPTASPTPSATPGYQPVACPSGVLRIADSSAAATVAPEAPVPFELALTNAGPVPCLLEAGPSTLGVVVYSGADRIWSSLDCLENPTERPLLLDVGVRAELSVTWDQVRSGPGCPQGQQKAQPGAYRAVVTTDGGGSAVLGWTRTFTIE